MLFKDYEYGWYGHHGSLGGHFMNTGYYHHFWHTTIYRPNPNMKYENGRNNTMKQINKILDVKFISGDYRYII